MLTEQQAAVVKGMLARGDKQHDIAALFGENGGRIADIKTGVKFSHVKPMPLTMLPPPGIDAPAKRYIDPNAPLEQQIAALLAMIKDPPENSRVIVFTPLLAEWILQRLNNNNRSRRPAKIRRFCAAMRQKEFLLTGDTVKFTRGGLLLDGQNRLTACVQAGVPFKTHCVFGIDDRAFPVIDSNAVRTNPDTMKIAGIVDWRLAAQATRGLIIAASENPADRGKSIENPELLDYYRTEINESRFNWAKERAIQVPKRIIPHGTLLAHLYLFHSKDAKLAARFADDLANGVKAGAKILSRLELLRKQNAGRIHENLVKAFLILAWNAYRANETVTAATLKWSEAKDYPGIA